MRNLVTSPGGTSAHALYQLEKGGFRGDCSAFVLAAGSLDFTRKMGDPIVHRMVDNVFEQAGAGRY